MIITYDEFCDRYSNLENAAISTRNNAVNGAIDTSATQLGDYFDATPEQRAGFSDDLYNAKWNVLQDQTLGAAGRGVKSLFGGKRDDRVAAQDAAMRAAA